MKAGETTKKPPRPNQCVFCQKGGRWQGECLECPFCGMLEGQPQPAFIPCNSLSNERFPCTDRWGQLSAHFQIPLDPSSLLHRVTLNVAERRIEFSVDTGTTCSVLTWPASPLSNRDCTETGVDRQPKGRRFLSLLACRLGSIIVTYSFFVCARMFLPLLGRVILNKLGATILPKEVKEPKQRMHLLVMPDDPAAGHQNIPKSFLKKLENR